MFDASMRMYGPLYYNVWWTVAGVVLVLSAVAMVVVILFVTRKKSVKSLATLKIRQPKIVDMDALKQKYLRMVDQVEQNYANHMIKASVAHQRLSQIARLFYCEAVGFRADIMTLSDLKQSKYSALMKNIEKLYPDEFDTLEKGSVKNAADETRRLVRDL